jgi:hypothetical protein
MSLAMAVADPSDARTKKLVLWGLRIVVALLFLAPAALALAGHSGMVKQFDAFRLGSWFRISVSLVQAVAALLVLVPPISLLAAIVLLLIDIGVLLAELVVVHGGFIHLVLFALPLLALISVQSGRFDRRLAELDK